MLSFKVTYYNRIAFRSLKQTIRACHISVQEPAPSLAEPVRSEFSIPPPTIGRSAKATRNRLLSHGLSSAGTVQPLGTLRTYSVLPQRELYTTPYLQVDESASCSASNRKCWKCGRETDGLKELFFCHCGVVQSPAAELTFFTLFNVEESFDVDVKKLSEVYKDLQKHLHPDKYSQQSEVFKIILFSHYNTENYGGFYSLQFLLTFTICRYKTFFQYVVGKNSPMLLEGNFLPVHTCTCTMELSLCTPWMKI